LFTVVPAMVPVTRVNNEWLIFYDLNWLKKFGKFAATLLPLRQFFIIYLSRKAEGYGPVKPWQPTM